ncbi:D-alanyl-D-alanine carboxypeptidase/D-alanyl-D-alanine-endopeptidase [Spirulina sp. CS-785/01]|uniref:D-alanyl-D-alanine carboxypeptidase/D-alanyl-D-alanine endopeptidase n=1 Tax=Spirulina sp. CS-785/01 TaxID=3021716 RepID=UPI00232F6332|nr:D-alanyl-D-alanine carboxypeptidase/D-alanyl-D-alanine-endopeptidase [Spirulina sp. CS-785/01]MDB9315462.1 D-alanyl-D-alanine carboxypeptidase/D-alanyl-D-alanine-endopeptidase [Spirulina sp. CS-785/01]
MNLVPNLTVALFLLFSTLPLGAQSPPTGVCEAELSAALEPIINGPEFARSRWGILIQPLNQDTPLYTRQAEDYFTPASNTKLLTTAAALHQLGANFRIETPILAQGTPPNLQELRIIGRGDPSLTTQHLETLVQELRDRNIQHIQQLTLIETTPPQQMRHPTWEIYDLNFYYGMPVNHLILNENTFNLTLYPQQNGQPVRLVSNDEIALQQWLIINQSTTRPPDTPDTLAINSQLGKPTLYITGELAANADPDSWAMAILNPALYFQDTLLQLLQQAGITVETAQIQPPHPLEKAKPQRLTLSSPPLSQLIRNTNQSSNNLYAEALLQQLGGLEPLQASLTDLGVPPNSYHLRDGSGLSRHTLLSPQAVVATLIAIDQTPQGQVFRDSLPLGGVSGTLRRRFQDTPLMGEVQAKTGTMTGVSTLSGYLDPPQYPPLVFSIMLNRSEQSVRVQREAIDAIVLQLWQLQDCQQAKEGK